MAEFFRVIELLDAPKKGHVSMRLQAAKMFGDYFEAGHREMLKPKTQSVKWRRFKTRMNKAQTKQRRKDKPIFPPRVRTGS